METGVKQDHLTITLLLVEELLIPLHEPKVTAWNTAQYRPTGSGDRFGKRLPRKLWPELTPVPDASRLDPVIGAVQGVIVDLIGLVVG